MPWWINNPRTNCCDVLFLLCLTVPFSMEATSHVAGWNEGRETNNDSASHLGGGGGGAVLSRYSSYFISQALNHSYLLWIYYLLWIQEAHNPCNLCSNDIKLLVRCLWHNKTNYVTSHGIFQNLCTQLSCNCCTRSHGRTAVYFQLKMQTVPINKSRNVYWVKCYSHTINEWVIT